eukprot:scaffold4682_cov154-Pinguiococcus_pyrenoidosus.AAC.5
MLPKIPRKRQLTGLTLECLESYLCTSLGDASVDLVLSMDALLHVGRDGQRQAMREAARVLRPGGLLLFSDIMQQDHVDDNNNALLRPVLDRIHLSSFGSAASYKRAAEDAGFVECSFESFQSNIAEHYGHVRALLLEKAEVTDMQSHSGNVFQMLTLRRSGSQNGPSFRGAHGRRPVCMGLACAGIFGLGPLRREALVRCRCGR